MKNITKEEWKELISSTNNNVVLDVRTPEECNEGMQANAQQLDFLQSDEFLEGIDKLDKLKTYFVYCRSGNRSGKTCQIMESKGFLNTYNLIGGMLDWDGEVIKK